MTKKQEPKTEDIYKDVLSYELLRTSKDYIDTYGKEQYIAKVNEIIKRYYNG